MSRTTAGRRVAEGRSGTDGAPIWTVDRVFGEVMRASGGLFWWRSVAADGRRPVATSLWRIQLLLRLGASAFRLRLPRELRLRAECREIAASGLFDPVWYGLVCAEALFTGMHPLVHFADVGWRRSVPPNPLFDVAWYRRTYLGADQQVNPLLHYVRVGAARGLRPIPPFDPDWYALQAAGSLRPGDNPLRHYYRTGSVQGLSPAPEFDHDCYVRDWPDAADSPLTPFGHYLQIGRLRRSDAPANKGFPRHAAPSPLPLDGPLYGRPANRAAVLIPIYNAPLAARQCVAAVLRYTPPHVRIVIIDDASSDADVADVLALAEGADRDVLIIRNPTNQGFTRTVNRGLQLTAPCDVIVLNSDTEVTARWFTGLQSAAYENPRIGTATALSNNASQFSVPERFDNVLPEGLTLADYARSIAQSDTRTSIDVPFGHGFCLYLKRSYLEAVGILDAGRFPSGYGEEVDLCLRGRRLGWRHVLATHSFVAHAGGASFGTAKSHLKAAGRRILDQAYPEYSSLLRTVASDAKVRRLRARVAAVCSAPVKPRYRKLIAVSADDAPSQSVVATAGRPSVEYRLQMLGRRLQLQKTDGRDATLVAEHRLASAPGPFCPFGLGYEEVVGRWLLAHAIDAVDIYAPTSHGAGLSTLARFLEIPVTMRLGDESVICPKGILEDERGRSCGGLCTDSPGDCVELQDPFGRRLKHGYVKAWQAAYRPALDAADTIVLRTDFQRRILDELFPGLMAKTIIAPDQFVGASGGHSWGTPSQSPPPEIANGCTSAPPDAS